MTFVDFQLDDGTVVRFEAAEPEGPQQASLIGQPLTDAKAALEASIASVQKLLSTIATKLWETVPRDLDQLEVAFSIKASAEVNGFVVAKGTGEANCTIRMTWKKAK